jgi:hypothetical protein
MTESSFINGRIQCKVERAAFTVVNGIDFDLQTTKYYLLLASGTEILTTSVLRHNTNRGVSSYSVLLTEVQNVGTDNSVSTMVLIHGSFMIVAWIGLTSIGIVMARYFKPAWQNKTICGQKVWFMWHVMCMFTTWALTIAGFIIIFIDLGEWITSVHAVLGCVVLGLSITQSVGAVFRHEAATAAANMEMF